MNQTKWCSKCADNRPVGEFYINKAKSDGLSGFCAKHQNQAALASSKRKRLEFIAAMGGACERCGFTDHRALQIDHVNGGGRADRGEGRSGSATFYRKVLANRDRFMLLCANCNWIKKHEQNETMGDRVYIRQEPTERIQGIGSGNAPGCRNLDVSPEVQRNRARGYWAGLSEEDRAARRRKQALAATGRKLVNGHWVHPG